MRRSARGGVLRRVIRLLAVAVPALALASSAGAQVHELSLAVPIAVDAGGDLAVTVSGAHAGEALDVVVYNGARVETKAAVGDRDGHAAVTFRPPFTDRAGFVTVTAVQRGRTASVDTYVRPGAAVDPVVGFVGGRSIVADGADHAMTVVVPEDVRGNPVADGTRVDIRTERPDGNREPLTAVVDGELAWLRFRAKTVQGRSFIATRVDSATSPVVDIRETADDPVAFGLTAMGVQPTADGRTLRTVRTDVLVDPNGNVLPDGTAATFLMDGPEGRGVSYAATVAGVAELNVPAPDQPGSVTLTAWCHGTLSTPITIDFPADLDTYPVTATRNADSSIAVVVGRVVGSLGGYVADGTTVHVTVIGPDGEPHEQLGLLEDGLATIQIAAHAKAQTVTVSVLGIEVTVDVTERSGAPGVAGSPGAPSAPAAG